MEFTHSLQNSLRTVVGLCLCLLVATATPVSQNVLDQFQPQADLLASQQTLDLVHLIRSILAYNKIRDSARLAADMTGLGDMHTSKRGFGIAGLDNVDMITSTLDRSRSMSRSRHGPLMSSGLTLNQLRALMAKAG